MAFSLRAVFTVRLCLRTWRVHDVLMSDLLPSVHQLYLSYAGVVRGSTPSLVLCHLQQSVTNQGMILAYSPRRWNVQNLKGSCSNIVKILLTSPSRASNNKVKENTESACVKRWGKGPSSKLGVTGVSVQVDHAYLYSINKNTLSLSKQRSVFNLIK